MRWFQLRRINVLRLLVELFVLLLLMAVGGLIVAAAGIIPIKASSGHWPITKWMLEFSMSRSVKTHSVGITPPRLDHRQLILKGAGHFETGCRPCHGSPDLRYPRIAQHMTPPAPDLSAAVSHWEPEELFYIVKHGVKFTGMPAWPARSRDDEVWAVTAFLLELPNLDAAQYRQLAGGEATEGDETEPLPGLVDPAMVPRAALQSCARCHGRQGEGGGEGAFPVLAGQSAEYLGAALHAYANGKRASGIMAPLAAGLSDEDVQQLSNYYAALPSPSRAQSAAADIESIQRGEAIATGGTEQIAACSQCHGPTSDGVDRNPRYPLLAGQFADYLMLQLQLFRSGHRGGSEYAHLMLPVATQLDEQQMRDLASYFASLQPAEQPASR